MSAKRLRNFVFTINNYGPTEIKQVEDFARDSCRYLVYGREIGDDKKTPHLQGYGELKRQTVFSKVKKALPKAHLEARKGTAAQASEYCKKEGDYKEFGTISKPGKRNDLADFKDALLGDNPPDDLELFSKFPGQYLRYSKTVDRVRSLRLRKETPTWQSVRVTVLWGDTGAGKTRRAYEIDPDLYSAYDQKDLKWWCGYEGQKTILIDEFRGHPDLAWFLRILDGYRMPIQVKGGSTFKAWNHVIITSNHPPEGWYVGTWDDANPLKRRLTSVVHMVKPAQGLA